MLTADQVREIVMRLLEEKSQRDLARQLGVSTAELKDYVRLRRGPSSALLDGLGLRRLNMYERIEEGE